MGKNISNFENFVNERYFSAEQREKFAKAGKALPDGSFPIENEEDLNNAIKSYGLSKHKHAAKAFIIKRAKDLGLSEVLPEEWKN